MRKAELEQYRQALLELRARLTGDVSQLADEALRAKEASANQSNMPMHMADVGSENFEQEFTLTLLQKEEDMLGEIDRALGRIAAGTFGLCEECNSDVMRERLKMLPYTRYCVDCARKLEKQA
jgi:RNA polymerase-binding protein DksA